MVPPRADQKSRHAYGGPASTFRVTDPEHSGVKLVMEQPDVNLARPVNVRSDRSFKAKYGALISP